MRRRWQAVLAGLVVIGAVLAWLSDESAVDEHSTPAARAKRERERTRWFEPFGDSPDEVHADGKATSGRTDRDAQGAPDGSAPGSAESAWSALDKRMREVNVSADLERNADTARRVVETYCAEAALTREHPLFPPVTHERDAAAFFAPLVNWEAKPGGQPVLGRMNLPAQLSQRMRDLQPGTWPYALTAGDAQGLDFSWMSQALQFDSWDMGNDPRFVNDSSPLFSATIPDFIPFQQWAKLRLAISLTHGDYAQAAAEVRHLAALCVSTQLLIGEMIGVALRSIENFARKLAVTRGLDVSAWPEAPDAERASFRRVDRSSLDFFQPGVAPEVMKRALECVPAKCTALSEGLGAHNSWGEYASTDTKPALLKLIAESGCHGAVMDRAANAPPLPFDEILEGAAGGTLERFLDGGAP